MNCGPVCVQWLERQYGNELDLDRARALCKTDEAGSYARDMMDALRKLGYPNVRERHDLTWRQLKGLLPHNHVVVCWWTPLEAGQIVDNPDKWGGHWSVVKRVTQRTVTLFDPDPETDMSMDWAAFDILWRDVEVFDNGRSKLFRHAAVVAGKK